MSEPRATPEERLDADWDAVVTRGGGAAESSAASERRFIERLQRVAASDGLVPASQFVRRLREQMLIERKGLKPMITGFHHLVLFCTDTERSRAWYARAGFEYNRGYGGMHWFNAGPYEIMLHPADRGPAGNSPHIHVATADVDAMFAHVRSQGLSPCDHQQPQAVLSGPVTRPWGEREFELEDPDGHRIVITQS